MAEVVLTNEFKRSKVGDIMTAIVRAPRLWAPPGSYSDVVTWSDRAESEVLRGTKRVMAAFDHRDPFGGIIYQRHKHLPGVAELKRIAFAPTMRGLHIASATLRLAEREIVYNDYPDVHTIMVDTKLGHAGMIGFLESEGYGLLEITDLYGLGDDLDAVFIKRVAPSSPHLQMSMAE